MIVEGFRLLFDSQLPNPPEPFFFSVLAVIITPLPSFLSTLSKMVVEKSEKDRPRYTMWFNWKVRLAEKLPFSQAAEDDATKV